MKPWRALLLLPCLLAACVIEDKTDEAENPEAGAEPVQTSTTPTTPSQVVVYGNPSATLSPEELERGRLDPSWRRVVQLDTMGASSEEGAADGRERWEEIGPRTLQGSSMSLPLQGDMAGPSVLRAQILLDRAFFSPGIVDGRWGKNVEKAVYWFQKREGLPANGRLDQATFARLQQVAGGERPWVRSHTLTAQDVQGPFVEIPSDIYAQARMECMCYESLEEKLAEQFHTTPEVLGQLNPGIEMEGLQAGEQIQVPAVREEGAAPSGARPARIVISDAGFYLHALDAQGRVLYHFPTTLGSDYAPSPSGEYRITSIAPDPTWHYQPALLTGVPDHQEDATIPAGPNNAVGVVWMALSKPHYGIHGTNAPETIGYTTSHGCVRLTNWDARFLSEQIAAGIPVEFRDVDNTGAAREAGGRQGGRS